MFVCVYAIAPTIKVLLRSRIEADHEGNIP